MPAESGHRYAWVCGLCEEEFDAADQGYYRAQQHQSTEHAGEHGVIRGIIDTDTGEVVVPGFGPRVLQKAQKEGYVPGKSQGGGGSSPGGGSKAADKPDRMPSGTKQAGIGVRTKQMFREVPLDLPLLETLFQRCRAAFGDGWDDSDAGFSAWLHDTILEAYRPHVMMLFGGGDLGGSAAALPELPSRQELAELILDPSRVLEGDLPGVYAVLFEALVWAQIAGPHQQWRSAAFGGAVA